MKRAILALMLATMLFSVGCGNQAKDAAKDAQQKVEQTANEAKDAANKVADDAAKKVDEAKDTVNQAADATKDAANKAADDTAAKVDEMKSDADKMANDMTSMMNERVIALGGVTPGSTTIEDIKATFGEATSVDGKVMTFVDGLKVTLDDANKVKEISTTGNSFETPEGMYVGASEYSLNDYCGPADSVRKITDGAEYEYNSKDKKSAIVYKAQNGVITEIICSLK